MAVQLPFQLGPRARKILRYVGFAVVGIVTFVITLQLTFPFDRVKDKVVEALAEKYEVTIGDVHGGIMPGRVYFKAVSLRTRPTTADEVASTFYIDQLQLDIGLFAALRGAAAIDLDAVIKSGRIKGSLESSKAGTTIELVGDDLPSANLPVRELVGLPMSGVLRFNIALDLPNDKPKAGKVSPNWLKAEGHVELACPSGCVVGDGKTKLKPKLKNQRNQAFAEGGIDFGKVNIDSLLGRVEIKNGKVDITKFDVKSSDGEVHLDLDVALNQDLNASTVAGCLRFRGSDTLLKREPKTHAAFSTTGAPLGPDNLFHIKLEGQLRDVRRMGLVCGPGAPGSAGTGSEAPPSRPNLTVTPDPPSHPPGGIVSPPPPLPGPTAPTAPINPASLQGAVVPTVPAPGSGSSQQPPQYPPAGGDGAGTVVPAVPAPVPQQPGEPPPAISPPPSGQPVLQ
jgi:type II secretion system protein N